MAKKTTMNEIGDMLTHVVERMVTKDDLNDLRREIKGDIASLNIQVGSIERQLRETKTEIRLLELEEKVFGSTRR